MYVPGEASEGDIDLTWEGNGGGGGWQDEESEQTAASSAGEAK